MTLLALAIAMLAMALFGLSTPDHHARRIGGHLLPIQRQRYRLAAWSAVVAAAVPAITQRGWIFGPLLWAGSMMLGAGVVFLALNLLPSSPRQRR